MKNLAISIGLLFSLGAYATTTTTTTTLTCQSAEVQDAISSCFSVRPNCPLSQYCAWAYDWYQSCSTIRPNHYCDDGLTFGLQSILKVNQIRPMSETGTCYNLPDCSGSTLGDNMDSNVCESMGGESMADNFGECTNF